MRPRWIELAEEKRYREALEEALLSSGAAGAQLNALAALVVAEALELLVQPNSPD
jgi:hypothetical protein